MRTSVFVIFILLLRLPVWSQLENTITDILSHPDIQNAQISISVRDENGEILYAKADEVLLIPASTTKVITTCSALGILGEDYRYVTTVGYRGEIVADGTLVGDIIIKGSGDPSLGSIEMENAESAQEVLAQITTSITSAGITCIDGKILMDDSIFDSEVVNSGWSWDDLTNYYAGGVWGVNFSDNRYDVSFSRHDEADRPTDISSIDPIVPGLLIDNQVRTGPVGSGDNAYIQGSPYDHTRFITGTIPPGKGTFTIQGSVPNPPLLMAYHLREKLKEVNVVSAGYGRYNAGKDNIVSLKELYSQPLYKLAKYANRVSENMYCDAFYKSIGAHDSGLGSWESGAQALESYLTFVGLDTKGHVQSDGSGLTYRNRISPFFMTDFLSTHATTLGVDKLKILLPKVGEEGTVKRFLEGYTAQSRAWLKSGSINAVIAYAGLLELSDRNHVFISVCSNGHSCSNSKARKQIGRIIDAVYQYYEKN